MSTLLDLDVLVVTRVRGSTIAATAGWTLTDAATTPVGMITERAGSAFALLRRMGATNRNRYNAMFDVVDADGNSELLLTRRPSNVLKTRIEIEAALADGRDVVHCDETSSAPARFEVADSAGVRLAVVEQIDGLHWRITDPAGTPLGEIAYRPITKSIVHRDGRDTEQYELEYRPEATARVRIGTLACVVAHSARRAM